jgi:hypothetical protein
MIFTLLVIYCMPTKAQNNEKKNVKTHNLVSKKPIARQKYRVPIHRKKSFSIFLSPSGISLSKLSLGGNNLYMTSLFPPRESLVSDIPAGDGNIEKHFLRCTTTNVSFALLNGWNVTDTSFERECRNPVCGLRPESKRYKDCNLNVQCMRVA